MLVRTMYKAAHRNQIQNCASDAQLLDLQNSKSIQHLHFPRGPPPEYSASSTTFDFRVLMVSGTLAVIWSYAGGDGEIICSCTVSQHSLHDTLTNDGC